MKQIKLITFILCVLTVVSWTTINEINERQPVCPDCLESSCIYLEIKSKAIDGNYSKAVDDVCRKRGITNASTITLLKNEPYAQ